jgi:hypothetical protein
MPARRRSPRAPKVLGIQARFKAHLEASERCEWWANKALEDLNAGRTKAARTAYAKAERYLLKMTELEPK